MEATTQSLFVSNRLYRVPSVRCSAATGKSASVFFPNLVGSSRADWQSMCAIINSKAVGLVPYNYSTSGSSGEEAKSPVINGHDLSASLDIVHVLQLPKPLSVFDLSLAPVHGSELRVAYQGVPGAYSEAAAGKALGRWDTQNGEEETGMGEKLPKYTTNGSDLILAPDLTAYERYCMLLFIQQ